MSALKLIAYPFGAAIAESLMVVLLLAGCAFGFNFAEWTELEGRIVGVFGTLAAVAGAAIGLTAALTAKRRTPK